MEYGYKIIRRLSMAALRQLCIEQDLYTNGDNYDYSNMLFKAKKEDITSDDIVEIAVDIIKHTDKLSIDDFTYVCDLILLKSYSFISEV